MTKLKICGITNLPDARNCAAQGADFLGFIRYEKSPRYVEAAVCKEMIEWLSGAKPVGVYVNAEAAFINQEAEQVGFRYIQLSGDESPDFCASIDLPVIKGLRVKPDDTAQSLAAQMRLFEPHVTHFLLDTFAPDAYGGTGHTFNWDIAATLATDFSLFLAGGLGAHNIRQAIETVHPFGVDLSSSIEEKAGVKDWDKLDALFEAWNEMRED